MSIWFGAAAAALVFLAVFAALFWHAPSRAVIEVDTGTATSKADLRLLWGLGPKLTYRAVPKKHANRIAQMFHDAPRIGHALITPGLVEAATIAVQRVLALNPRVGAATLALNLGDTAQDLVVQTAMKAALATAPASYRERITITKNAALGAAVNVKFELTASPAKLWSIYSELKTSRSAQEFRRRLRRKVKAPKKAPKAVTTS